MTAKKSAPRKKRPRARDKLVGGYPPDGLVGRKIVQLRPMTRAEVEQEGWAYAESHAPTAVVLEDGSVLFPAHDSGGRIAPAYLLGNTPDNKPFSLLTVMEAETTIDERPQPATPRDGYPKSRPLVCELGRSPCPG